MFTYILLSVLLVLSQSRKPNIGDLFTPIDEEGAYFPTAEELESLLPIQYSSNGIIEDTFTYILKKVGEYQEYIPILNKLPPIGTSEECQAKQYTGPDMLKFFPTLLATVKEETSGVTFKNNCFRSNVLTMSYNADKTEAYINIEASDPISMTCVDTYVVSISGQYGLGYASMKGSHTITLKRLNEDDLLDISVNGMRVFSFCEGLTETIEAIYKTIRYFMDCKVQPRENHTKYPYYGDKPVEEVEKEHMEFLRDYAGMEIYPRGPKGEEILDIEPYIQSGDFLGLTQIDSFVSTFIMFLSGGRISHAAIALRLGENNDLYVAEMKGTGLIISTWKEFCDEQVKTRHYFVHIPLKEELRQKFNTSAAYDYFKSLYPMPYGDYNLLFAWIDTVKDNLPTYIDFENFLLILGLIEKFDRSVSHINFGAALNMRLGTENLGMHEIAIEAAKRGMTYEELATLPEQDYWRYDNGENIICSGFVVEMYRQAGIIPKDMVINAKEFQPKDIYLLDIFDRPSWKDERPDICKEVDPDLPYCQVYGTYRLDLEGLGTWHFYDNMFEKCPSKPPLYPRLDGC